MHAEDWARETHKDQVPQAFKLVQTRPAEGLALCERLANAGSATAMVYAGIIYRDGLGRPPDSIEAEKWFRMAADKGTVSAYHFLGCLYGRLNRLQESREAFAIAGAKDYGPALNLLGRIYASGHGVEKNIPRAIQYFERASEVGHLGGRILLARLLMRYPTTWADTVRGLLLYVSWWPSVINTLIREGISSDRLI
jgi:TPR repeat protein